MTDGSSNNEENLSYLTNFWYKKLKDSGFDDIEDTTRPDSPIKTWHSRKWMNVSPLKIELASLYYDKARELLLTHKFESEVHRLIWELHCDGLSKRSIALHLKENSLSTLKRESVGQIITLIRALIV